MQNNTMPQGGKREGAGRPKGDPTETVSFRVDKEALQVAKELYGRSLNKKINDFIKRLAKKAK
jgi:hypothetical protein